MIYLNLSKKEKQIARRIIEKGLQNEYSSALEFFFQILLNWKKNNEDNRQSYYKIFKAVKNFDKYIARHYDNLTGSKYMMTIVHLLIMKMINKEDLKDFSEETRNKILWAVEQFS